LVFVVCLLGISRWREQIGDVITAGWLAIAFPALIIGTGTFYYPGFYICWQVLLIVLLAALIPGDLPAVHKNSFAGLLLATALVSSTVQYAGSAVAAAQPNASLVQLREFYQRLATLVLAQPEPRTYSFIFSEIGGEFTNQVFFDIGPEQAASLHLSPAFVSIHDSFYRRTFGNMSADQIIQRNIAALEQTPGTLVVADCEPSNVLKRPEFAPDPSVDYRANGSPLAAEIAIRESEYLLNSPRWQAIARIDSPFGCLYAYRYTTQPLKGTEKWSRVLPSGPAELALALPVGPNVRLFDYHSAYQPEQRQGVYYQWLPGGPGGIHMTLSASKAITVVFRAGTTPGPARADHARRLRIRIGSATTTVPVAANQAISIPLRLQEGLNEIDISVEETADTPPSGPDKRELMLLLVSPHLAPAPQ